MLLLRFAVLLVACALLAVSALPALAADAAPAWGEWLKPWWDMVTQGVIAAVVMMVAAGAKRWFGVSLEESHQRTLHLALKTGADAAWAKLMQWTGQGLSREEIELRLISETIAHAQGGAADAIAVFNLDEADPRLINLAISKLKQTAPQGAAAFSSPPELAAIAA
jgi:type IV secretory pathway VirB2 component (pilin)